MQYSNEYKLDEGRDLLANIGHEHADAYNELDILEQCAVEGFDWNGRAWVPEATEMVVEEPLPRPRKPPEPLDARLRRLGAPTLPGF
jgi:hypothetical protein